MTLLDAKEFNPEQESRRKKRLILGTLVLVVLLGLVWWFWYWPEKHIVSNFFEALQKQDFKTAYAIWQHDPEWQKHLDRKPIHDYPFNEFYRDWGPGGEWGVIKTARVNGASPCVPPPSSGILVDVIVNDRVEHAQVFVDKSSHTIGYPPCELIFH